ncbi:hypothetical protein JKP88DRAFT_333376 [Tribonema minus]|uniref:Mediator of RNA polymerase II transcription subunit 8 n=1 Tax=Tribonema minus TaxID=303371 RepID=A0A835YKI8_9STRA|nr:hypothetical protein JKP88DRAFT_333376 [Tribonema minus]
MESSIPALNAVRNQANAIRTTLTHHIERELRMNGNPSWPELINSFQVVARQLADLAEDVDPVLQFFAFQPVRPTANPAHIPLFLSTRPLAEMDAADAKLRACREGKEGEGAGAASGGAAAGEDVAETYNTAVQSAEDAYEKASQAVLASITAASGTGRMRPANPAQSSGADSMDL